MGDLLGIILPMLMRGADVMDIVRAVAGANYGASNDGLMSMMDMQRLRAMMAYPLRPDQSVIDRGASGFLDAMGVNPMTGFGQGLAGVIGSLYHFMPDIIGSAIGVPDPGQFFRTIANGSSGISVASGNGAPSIFNPFSVMDAHENAMRMAQGVYGMAARRDGQGNPTGYNIDFTHGLNMSEVGLVTQRMLSSDLAYRRYGYDRDRNGRVRGVDFSAGEGGRLDMEKDADEFGANLKELGSKFNETASMLAKITGSVEDALRLMDDLAGGNFLGGTAQQAISVANKAKNIAAAVRVTAAMSNISPAEAFSRIGAAQQGMVGSFGVDAGLAQASGFSGMMFDPAYRAAMAYNTWEAQNPNASISERKTMWAGTMGRATSFADSSAEHVAAIVSANRNLFSENEIGQIETAFRTGNPNSVRDLVVNRIGFRQFYDMMSDPAMIMAARLNGDRDIQRRLWNAGVEGNLYEAESAGARVMYDYSMQRIDDGLRRSTGQDLNGQEERENASLAALRKMAVNKGLAKENAENMNLGQLRGFLIENGVDARMLERVEKTAEIDRQMELVGSSTMSSAEESAARQRLVDVIGRQQKKYQEGKIAELEKEARNTQDMEAFFEDTFKGTAGYSNEEIETLRAKVFGGKITSARARSYASELSEHRQTFAVAHTPEEILRAANKTYGSFSVSRSGKIAGIIGSEDFSGNNKSDAEALDYFVTQVNEASDAGILAPISDVSKAYGEAATALVGKAMDGRIGDLSQRDSAGVENKEYRQMIDAISSRMASGLQNGEEGYETVNKAFSSAVSSFLTDGSFKGIRDKIGDKGLEQMNVFKEKGSDIMNRGQFASAMGIRINRDSFRMRNEASESMTKLMTGDGEIGADALAAFRKNADVLAAAGAITGKIDDKVMVSSIESYLSDLGLGDIEGLDVKAIARGALDDFVNQKNGVKDWRSAIERNLGNAGKTDAQKKSIEEVRKNLGGSRNVGSDVLKRMLMEVALDSTFNERVKGNAAYVAGGKNQAMLNKAAATASANGIDMGAAGQFEGENGEGLANAVSAVDAADANASQNRVQNAIYLGESSLAKDEIEKSKKRFAELQSALKDMSVEELRTAAGWDRSYGEALDEAIGKSESEDIAKDKEFLGSLSKIKVDGVSGAELLKVDGEKVIEKLSSDEDRERFKRLRGALSGLSSGYIQKTLEGEAASSKLDSILGAGDQADFDRGFIKTLSTQEIGGERGKGLELLKDKDSKGMLGLASDEDWAGITKGAYKEGSASNEILNAVSGILDFVSQVRQHPIPVVIDHVKTTLEVKDVSPHDAVSVM